MNCGRVKKLVLYKRMNLYMNIYYLKMNKLLRPFVSINLNEYYKYIYKNINFIKNQFTIINLLS